MINKLIAVICSFIKHAHFCAIFSDIVLAVQHFVNGEFKGIENECLMSLLYGYYRDFKSNVEQRQNLSCINFYLKNIFFE